MAIFGDFSDFHFREVLALVGRRTGKLRLRETVDYPKMDIHIDEGKIRGLMIGDELVDESYAVRDHLSRIVASNKGIFEFTKAERHDLYGDLLQMGLQLLENLTGEDEEIRSLRDNFPHSNTRFVFTGHSDPWVEGGLRDFLDRSRPYLANGVDAEELGSTLSLSLEQVQLRLYKLRLKNVIAPVRAGWAPPPPPPSGRQAGTTAGDAPKRSFIHEAFPQAKRIDLSQMASTQTTVVRHTVETVRHTMQSVSQVAMHGMAGDADIIEYSDDNPAAAPATALPTNEPAKGNRTGVIQKMLFALYPRRWKF